MPVPPPPPPPMMAAPSPGQDSGRGMLLQSIRSGKTLKKTVTVDKSAPALSGKVRGETSISTSSTSTNANSCVPSNNGGPPSLGGLFSGGMPKLKPTGLRSNIGEKDVTSVSPSVKRGPPPVPPPATQKPQMAFAQMASSIPESAAELPPVVSASTHAPSKGFGKPMLAPKPPGSSQSQSLLSSSSQKPSPPPKKLSLLSGGVSSVSRAQSMRLPRSPPVLAPTPSSLHQSQDCLNESSQHRPITRILRPPVARPPSPPTSKAPPAPPPITTRIAPPPPPPPPSRLAVTAPSMPPPPPPPPNRSTSMHQRLAPPPPPPTPPTRGASAASVVRNGNLLSQSNATLTTSNITNNSLLFNADLEVRFSDKFHSICNFPNPTPFQGFPKIYNSKNAAKQQAPAPPLQSASDPSTMLQLNASSGAKQWQHNAASSAC